MLPPNSCRPSRQRRNSEHPPVPPQKHLCLSAVCSANRTESRHITGTWQGCLVTEWHRRAILRASAVAAIGTTGLAAVGAAALRRGPQRAVTAAHLRGAAPLPHAQIISLDRVAGRGRLSDALRTAHRAVAAADGGSIAAWLALGEGVLPERASKPRHLTRMPHFPGDVLDPAQSHGDLLLQFTGTSARGAHEAAQRTLRVLPQWRVRWRMEGVRAENHTEGGRGLSRNPFHFTEGYGNSATLAGTADRASVRAEQNEPAWAVGGSYQVIRIVRLATGFWDRDTVHEQERIIGRRRDGRWLDGTPKDEEPVFAADPRGKTTPLDAHVRRAAPDRRNPPPIIRRGYNYKRGNDDQGLIFSCFQRDLSLGFEAVQKRLNGEAMANYVLTVGGGYFFVPPTGGTWIGELGRER
ncbi:Dyp-type peroxidase [Streptomyces phaeochromogenes]|uniref:Dyp-type peroxidase n=1 Tax=Streptomyces phaeochromogenes TaxID=1923 RepID=UPI003677FC66